ncbi:MAG: hypothetical protein RBT11_14910 [Desulfobacterales bacterium]|jgi:hypothetical protein|nr:hypothetical protein [Desulfobacterales bacterium]
MNNFVTLELEDSEVRFTPDGRIAVVDAIAALSDEIEAPDIIWEELKRTHPEINQCCNEYAFSEKETAVVADSEDWMRIQSLLLDHLIDNDD